MHILLIIFSIFVLSSCKDDSFGDDALKYVNNHVNVHSRALVVNDAQYRFLNASSLYLAEVNNSLNKSYDQIKVIVTDLNSIESDIDNLGLKQTFKKNISHYETIKELSNQSVYLERTSYKANTVCSEISLKKRALHKNALTFISSSFINVGSYTKYYEPGNYVLVGGKINYDGASGQDSSTENLSYDPAESANGNDAVQAAGAVTGMVVYLYTENAYLAMVGEQVGEMVASTIVNDYERKIFRKQKKELDKAMKKIPQKVITEDETFIIVKKHCKDQKNEFKRLYSDLNVGVGNFSKDVKTLKEKYFSLLKRLENQIIARKEYATLSEYGFLPSLQIFDDIEFEVDVIGSVELRYHEIFSKIRIYSTNNSCFDNLVLVEDIIQSFDLFENDIANVSTITRDKTKTYILKLLELLNNKVNAALKLHKNDNESRCK
jgi:hypothetical protein